jgi:hypothetical protein
MSASLEAQEAEFTEETLKGGCEFLEKSRSEPGEIRLKRLLRAREILLSVRGEARPLDAFTAEFVPELDGRLELIFRDMRLQMVRDLWSGQLEPPQARETLAVLKGCVTKEDLDALEGAPWALGGFHASAD